MFVSPFRTLHYGDAVERVQARDSDAKDLKTIDCEIVECELESSELVSAGQDARLNGRRDAGGTPNATGISKAGITCRL